MLKINSPLASTDAEINGVEREVGGITFRLKPFSESNRKAMLLIATLRDHDETLSTGTLINKNLPEIVCSLVAGWSGLEDEDGKEIAYSEETSAQLFGDHAKLLNAVFSEASELGEEEAGEVDSDSGNSEA